MRRTLAALLLALAAFLAISAARFACVDTTASRDAALAPPTLSGACVADAAAAAVVVASGDERALAERAPLPASGAGNVQRAAVASAAPAASSGPPATLYGRVIVDRNHSPKGLHLALRFGFEKRAQIALGHDGKFEWTGLPAGECVLVASGLADVTGARVQCSLRLAPGEVREFVWDLSDRCPAVVALQIAFDGVATRSTVQLRLGEAENARDSGMPFATNRRGSSRVRVTDIDHRTSDGVLGALGLYVSNVVRGDERPEIACVGQPVALATLSKGASVACEVDVRTALVRVLLPPDGALPPPNGQGVRMLAVGAESHRATPASSWHRNALVELELDATRSPLAEFRAGPGTYFLRTWPYERESQTTLVIRGTDSVVECRLAAR